MDFPERGEIKTEDSNGELNHNNKDKIESIKEETSAEQDGRKSQNSDDPAEEVAVGGMDYRVHYGLTSICVFL